MKLMRTLIPLFLVLAFFASPGATLNARAQTKIATVDISKLLTGYWKTKNGEIALQNNQADLRKELKDMSDGLDKAEADYKSLLAQADDPTISDVERDRRKQAASDKNKEINEHKVEIEQFTREADSHMQDQIQRMKANLFADIKAAVATKAKLAGYSLVLNSASDAVMFNSGDTDITTDVLAQLNAGAPFDVNAPSTNSPAPVLHSMH